MKYYSGKGDDGMTDIAGKRIKKNENIIKLVGALDELNSFIGYSMSKIRYEDIKLILKDIEYKLYIISAHVTGYSGIIKKDDELSITKEDVSYLESKIDSLAKETEDITKFIYPNGSESATILNICRTITRKVERFAIDCGIRDENLLAYLNRLSSLFFVLFRVINEREEFKEEFF